MVHKDFLNVDGEEADVIEYEGHFIDDMSGQKLKTELVIQARKEEIAMQSQYEAYGKVPNEEAWW